MKLFKYIMCLILCIFTFATANVDSDCIRLTKKIKNGYDDYQVNYGFNAAKLKNKNCVELDAGVWRFREPIVIPHNLTLKGTYTSPHGYDTLGTRILCEHHKGIADDSISSATYINGSCVIALSSTVLEGLTMIWPDQTNGSTQPAVYPWAYTCLNDYIETIPDGHITDPGRCKMKNVTLVNAYRGINLGSGANDYHISGINMTAYKLGIYVNNISSLGIVEDVNIGIQYASQYHGWDSTAQEFVRVTWLHKIAFGIDMRRVDWGDFRNVTISDVLAAIYTDINHACYTDTGVEKCVSYDMPYYPKNSAWWQCPQVYMDNVNMNNNIYSIYALAIQKPAGLQFRNSILDGAIFVNESNWGPIHILNSTIRYNKYALTGNAMVINNEARHDNINITDSQILVDGSADILYNWPIIRSAGNLSLLNTNIITNNKSYFGSDYIHLQHVNEFISLVDGKLKYHNMAYDVNIANWLNSYTSGFGEVKTGVYRNDKRIGDILISNVQAY